MISVNEVDEYKSDEVFKFNKKYNAFDDDLLICNYKVYIDDKNKIKRDKKFFDFSLQYFNAFVHLYCFCNEYRNKNSVVDNLGFTMLYFGRHSLELIVKAIVIKNVKGGLAKCIKCKHSLELLFSYLNGQFSEEIFNEMKQYFKDIDLFDKKSDLFRYPFNVDFLKIYRNTCFNVIEMSLKLMYYYNVLHKEYLGVDYSEFDLEDIEYLSEIKENNEGFIITTGSGFGNCYLWQFHEIDCHRQIEGYMLVANILWYSIKNNIGYNIELPLMYSLRHLIEMSMKNIILRVNPLLQKEIENNTQSDLCVSLIKEHQLSGILLDNVNSIMKTLINEGDWPVEEYEEIKRLIQLIDDKDKNDDFFRYPISKDGTHYNYSDINLEAYCDIAYRCFSLINNSVDAVEVLNDILDEIYTDIAWYYK